MTIVWSKMVDEILGVGRSLEDLGVRNWALTRSQALEALARLEVANIPILGGDVYEFVEGNLRPTPDSWYCDRERDEAISLFASRSAAAARNYIVKYRPAESDVFFVLVPDT